MLTRAVAILVCIAVVLCMLTLAFRSCMGPENFDHQVAVSGVADLPSVTPYTVYPTFTPTPIPTWTPVPTITPTPTPTPFTGWVGYDAGSGEIVGVLEEISPNCGQNPGEEYVDWWPDIRCFNQVWVYYNRDEPDRDSIVRGSTVEDMISVVFFIGLGIFLVPIIVVVVLLARPALKILRAVNQMLPEGADGQDLLALESGVDNTGPILITPEQEEVLTNTVLPRLMKHPIYGRSVGKPLALVYSKHNTWNETLGWLAENDQGLLQRFQEACQEIQNEEKATEVEKWHHE